MRRSQLAVVLVLLLGGGVLVGAALIRGRDSDVVRIGSKNFTEQIVLGELVAQAIEAAGLRVERRLNLGGTFICDRALRSGDIDAYVEYTGTAHAAIFHEPPNTDPRRCSARSAQRYADAGLTLLEPLGFENTFAILVRGEDARRLCAHARSPTPCRTRGRWRAGFGYEFLQRADGYPGLATYGLRFAAPPRAMDLSLIYRALAEQQVDLIAGDATSGLIDAYDLMMLEDNRRYFPPYDAAVVAQTSTLLAHPDCVRACPAVGGRIYGRPTCGG